MSKPINSIEDGYLGSLRREDDGRHLVAVTLEKLLASKIFESYSPINEFFSFSLINKNIETLAFTKIIPPQKKFLCTGAYVSGDNRGIVRLKKNRVSFAQGRTWFADFSKRIDAAIILSEGDSLTLTVESPSENGVFEINILGWEYDS